MDRVPSPVYIFGPLLSAVLVTIGSWLPWIRKIPVGFDEGQPYYTDEWIWGLEPGFQTLDYILILLGLIAVAAPLIARYRGWSASGIVIGSGLLILTIAGGQLTSYLGQYIIEPGFYLVVVSGVLLVLIGLAMPRNLHPLNPMSDLSWRRES